MARTLTDAEWLDKVRQWTCAWRWRDRQRHRLHLWKQFLEPREWDHLIWVRIRQRELYLQDLRALRRDHLRVRLLGSRDGESHTHWRARIEEALPSYIDLAEKGSPGHARAILLYLVYGGGENNGEILQYVRRAKRRYENDVDRGHRGVERALGLLQSKGGRKGGKTAPRSDDFSLEVSIEYQRRYRERAAHRGQRGARKFILPDVRKALLGESESTISRALKAHLTSQEPSAEMISPVKLDRVRALLPSDIRRRRQRKKIIDTMVFVERESGDGEQIESENRVQQFKSAVQLLERPIAVLEARLQQLEKRLQRVAESILAKPEPDSD